MTTTQSGFQVSAALPTTALPELAGLPAREKTRVDRLALALAAAGLLLSIVMAARSDGVHHDDDMTHYVMAAWSSTYPSYLLHEWGRPGFTVLYALPAQFGWTGARIFSGILTALTGWLAYRIAVQQQLRLAPLAPALLWLQPMTFTLSYTTLTETVLAFYLALGFDFLMRKRYAWSAAVFSLCMVTRHEGAVFVGLLAFAFLLKKRPWYEWLWLAWAPLVHNALSYLVFDSIPAMMFLQPRPTDEYGAGGWFTMISRWPLAAGVGPIILACAGVPSVWRHRDGKLWVLCGAAYLFAHVVIYRFGLFASGGYYRFLVPLGPVIAVTAAAALSECWTAIRTGSNGHRGPATTRAVRRTILWGTTALLILWLAGEVEAPAWFDWAMALVRIGVPFGLAACGISYLLAGAANRVHRRAGTAVFPLAMLAVTLWQPVISAGVEPPFQECAPLILVDDQILVREAVDWLRREGLTARNIYSANGWVNYFLERPVPPKSPGPVARLQQLSPGELFVWEARYAPSPAFRISLEDLRRRPDLVELAHGRPHPNGRDGIYWYVFEKRGDAAARRRTDPTSSP